MCQHHQGQSFVTAFPGASLEAGLPPSPRHCLHSFSCQFYLPRQPLRWKLASPAGSQMVPGHASMAAGRRAKAQRKYSHHL